MDESAIQPALLRADHEHSRSEVTVSVPLPPDAGSSGALLVTATWHLVAVGPVTFVLVEEPQAAATAHANRIVISHARAGRTRNTYVVTIAGQRAAERRHSLRKSATYMQFARREAIAPRLSWAG